MRKPWLEGQSQPMMAERDLVNVVAPEPISNTGI